MASPRKLAHIALATCDVARMRDWYCEVLEARVVFENEMLCFTTYDDEHHRVVFAKPPGFEAKPGTPQNLHHVSFTFATLDELLASYERLRDRGLRQRSGPSEDDVRLTRCSRSSRATGIAGRSRIPPR